MPPPISLLEHLRPNELSMSAEFYVCSAKVRCWNPEKRHEEWELSLHVSPGQVKWG